MSKTPNKETIYIDVEDDVTAIIEKVRSASGKVVALVVPKRSTTLQSAVNLKLIKRAAKSSKKAIVLITSDATMLSLAGSIGVHVAKTLQSKPEIPKAEAAAPIDEELDASKPIEELASKDAIEVDNEAPVVPQEAEAAGTAKKASKKLRAPKIKIPNFEKFRLRLFIGLALLIVLIGGWLWAGNALPKAEIIVTTDNAIIDSDVTLTANTDAEEVDVEKSIVPAYIKELKKTSSEQVKATGSRDEGKKAKGTLTLTNCIDDGESKTIPAGTGFTSESGLTYVTSESISLSAAYYDDGECKTEFASTLGFSGDAPVTAIEAGDKYNIKAQAYNPPAAYNTSYGSIRAEGDKMTGGTTKIVTFVSQSDVEAATQAVIDEVEKEATAELAAQFTTDQALAIEDTFKSSKPKVNSEPKVDQEVKAENGEATVTVSITYSQMGIKNEYLTQLIEEANQDQIDPTSQVIQNTGLENADIVVLDTPSEKELKLRFLTTVIAGPQLEESTLKQDVAGEKKARTREIIEARPGVTAVEVNYSPFWVITTPEDPDKVTIIVQQQNDSE